MIHSIKRRDFVLHVLCLDRIMATMHTYIASFLRDTRSQEEVQEKAWNSVSFFSVIFIMTLKETM